MSFTQASILIGLALPFVVGFVAHSQAPSQVKAGLLLVFTAAAAALQSAVTGWTWHDFYTGFETQLAAAVVGHFGVTSPLKLTGSDGAVAQVGLAVGAPADLPVDPTPDPVEPS